MILEAASRLFRERGYDGVGVDAIMAEVGLTAGGFYAHFPSKKALFAESLTNAYEARNETLSAQASFSEDTQYLQNLIFSYLSRTHRNMTSEGCIFPALTADVGRGDDETRESYEARLNEFLSTIEAQLPNAGAPPDQGTRERAIGVLVQMIGGILIARAVKDEKLSTDILKACRQAAMKLSEG